MIDHLRVEHAGLADASALTRLINDAYRGASGVQGWTHEVSLFGNIARIQRPAIDEIIRSESSVVLKCVDYGGTILGSVQLERRAGDTYLGLLSVSPKLQGQGIGKKLLAAGEEHARSERSDRIVLSVISKRTELIEWYERRGYQLTGERQPVPGVETGLEFVVLAKTLT